MMIAALAALLLQASPDDPPLLSSIIDSSVRTIAGYPPNMPGKAVPDDVFLKRLMRDLVDADPAEAELKAFVADSDPKKRSKKISQLLEDPRYGPFWADRFAEVFFGDLKTVRFAGLGPLAPGVEPKVLPAFTKWLGAKLQKDTPWTEIVTQLLDARGTLEVDPAMAYKLSLYREPGMEQAFAEGVARHFLGIRLRCARCHDHPFDKWRMEDYYGLAAFASGQRAERGEGGVILRYRFGGQFEYAALKSPKSKDINSVAGTATPRFLFGGKAEQPEDFMKSLAFYMTDRSNTQLPRALANRVWGWMFGRGLLHPVDDYNLRNKSLSPVLSEALTRSLIDSKYSLKQLLRAICTSQEYQLPGSPDGTQSEGFRRLAFSKNAGGNYTLFEGVQPKEKRIVVPEGWLKARPKFAGVPARALYVSTDPKDRTRHAELWVIEGKPQELNPGQFLKPRSSTSELQGKLKVSLEELSGVYLCKHGTDEPLDYAILLGRTEAGSFRLEGPADLVAAAREDFLKLLKSVSKE